jgi:hypothetical protein
MASNRYSGPDCPNNLTSTIEITTRVLLISTLALVAFCLLSVPTHPAHASSGGSLSLGAVQGVSDPYTCQGPVAPVDGLLLCDVERMQQ